MFRTNSEELVAEIIYKNGMLNYNVLEGMADWVRVVDDEGLILYANKPMKEALGEDIVGGLCYLATGKEKECSFCITTRSIERGEIVQKEEEINGKYFSVKSSPVKNSKGENFAAVEVFRDVTRERNLELQLIKKNKIIKKDLCFARKIQEKILPEKGKIGNLLIDYIYEPSEMLSGDMFDVFMIDDDNIGIYVSDVVGHGIAASMMTMFIRQTMRAIKYEILSPGAVLKELHKKFSTLDLDADKYFTIFYGVFNKSTYKFKYSNAGHNSVPIKFNEKEIKTLEMNGYPISLLFNEIFYEEKEIQLSKGDKILFYTDGITESKNKAGIEFGIERVINIIKNHKKDLLIKIEREIMDYSWGEQEDDFALILMEVLE